MSARAAKRRRGEAKAALVDAYAALAAHTAPLCGRPEWCGQAATEPCRCCADMFCAAAARYARATYGVRLEPVRERGPRYLDPVLGCVVPPHLRPGCAGFSCAGAPLLRWARTRLGDGGVLPSAAPGERVSQEWDTEYLRLHDRCARLSREASVAVELPRVREREESP